MVLTTVQITNFFTQASQIGVPTATMDRLQQEGMASPVDLKDFDDEALKIVKENLQHPAGRIANPNPNANGATIPTPGFCVQCMKPNLSSCNSQVYLILRHD